MLKISNGLLAQIKAHGERTFPNECCGIVFGTYEEAGVDGLHSVKVATELLPIDNQFEGDEQYHRFLITEEQMLHAELSARKRGLDIVGIYHSHPDCASVASEYDRSHSVPVYSFLITSVMAGKAVDVQNWTLVWNEEKGDNVFVAEEFQEI